MANSSDASAADTRGRWLLWIGYAACIWALLSGLNHAYQNIIDAQFIAAVHANALNILVMLFPSLL